MAYELLYTRPISSDDRVRFTDVPITSPSIMVDVLSLRSPFYRIAGYAYSIISDGLIDYERGKGYTLPFGKNRLLFPASPLPYFLEFFPKWGTKQAIISVYTGEPSPQEPPGIWKQALGSPYQMRRNNSPRGASYRLDSSSEVVDTAMNGAIESVMDYSYVFWRLADGSCWYKEIGTNSNVALPTSSPDYASKLSLPNAIIL